MSAVASVPSKRRVITTTAIVYLILVGVILVGAVLVAVVAERNFFSPGNVRDILTGMSALGLIAVGQTVVILGGSLDLSVPYVTSLASLIAAETMRGSAANIPAAVGLTLLVAALIGLANGAIVTGLKVNGFIATLGTGLIVKGYLDTNYQGTAGNVAPEFRVIGTTLIGPIPLSTILMIVVAVVVALALRYTRTGHQLYAVGGNTDVARLSGVRTAPPLIVAHIVSALCAAFAGMLLASRSGVGNPTFGSQGGYDLLSIAAVVLGGTLLLGGRGGIWGTIGGVAIFAVIDNVMSVLAVNPYLKDVVRGTVIVVAVAIYTGRVIRRRHARFSRKEELR